ncbi:NAD(P)H-dependent oxidoreductase [Candidatus Peribacteria bacterium]|nr:NAD(P)H-dependent oxidoreductase [Candidatus Peribacteria bacterium]
MNILVLSCSPNDPSNCDVLAQEFIKGAKDVCACTVQIIRLIDFELPQFTLGCYDEQCDLPANYMKLKKAILDADGVVIAAPVWNFGVPAHVKNFQDWMGCFCLDTETRSKGQLGGKPFFYIFTGGAPKAAWKGLMRFTTMFIRECIRYFGGTITGMLYEGHCTLGKGKFGLVVDKRPKALATARKQGARFALFTRNYKKTGVLPLKHRTIEWFYKKGQRLISKF